MALLVHNKNLQHCAYGLFGLEGIFYLDLHYQRQKKAVTFNTLGQRHTVVYQMKHEGNKSTCGLTPTQTPCSAIKGEVNSSPQLVTA